MGGESMFLGEDEMVGEGRDITQWARQELNVNPPIPAIRVSVDHKTTRNTDDLSRVSDQQVAKRA